MPWFRMSTKCEFIELKDLSLNDRIDLAAPAAKPSASPRFERHGQGRVPERPSQSMVVRMVGDSVSVERPSWLSGTAGKGHNFQPCSYTQFTWCDLCGDFILGLYRQSLCCANCRYTCHYRCLPLIQLDCSPPDINIPSDQSDVSKDTIETDTNVDEKVDWGKQDLSLSEIQQKVKEFNAQINSNLYMVLNKDGTYTGFIKVHFKLIRPVSIPPPQKFSLSPEVKPECSRPRRRTSFYLPRNTAKHLHISSKTRAQEVIVALLNKFTVVDNPAKFALFERSEQESQVHLRRLSNDECPLRLRLCAGPNEKVLSLVLKENETGEVNWDAFSLPELCNFLRILQREEEEHVRQIVRRYGVARDKMETALAKSMTPV